MYVYVPIFKVQIMHSDVIVNWTPLVYGDTPSYKGHYTPESLYIRFYRFYSVYLCLQKSISRWKEVTWTN